MDLVSGDRRRIRRPLLLAEPHQCEVLRNGGLSNFLKHPFSGLTIPAKGFNIAMRDNSLRREE